MKTILCYGDSNTYGFDPATGFRYSKAVRWTGKLQNLLGDEYTIIEEGCNGRTTIFEDPVEGWKKGIDYLRPCLNTHKPIDMVVLMLGTNDLKELFQVSAKESAGGIKMLVEVIRSFTKEKQGFVPQVLLVSPVEIGEGVINGAFCSSFGMRAVKESKQMAEFYRSVAQETGCIFYNAAEHIQPSETDYVHLSVEGHSELAEHLYDIIHKELAGGN